jgi:hypothetical protein
VYGLDDKDGARQRRGDRTRLGHRCPAGAGGAAVAIVDTDTDTDTDGMASAAAQLKE